MKISRDDVFAEMCKTCMFNDCNLQCKHCHCIGYSKTAKKHYCKCLDAPTSKEKRCYYYRRDRECKR